jgi:hypothetical protein
MDVTTILIIVIAVIVLALIAAVAMRGKQRSELKSKFGPEYERTVDQRDDRREAEAELREREKKRESLDIRPLSDGDRTTFVAAWDRVEARFVEDPDGAAREGDRIVADVMSRRGYPVEGRDHTDVLSVDHPDLVDRYREALRTTSDPRSATTEELRQAMLDLRATFEKLAHSGREDTHDQETRR